MKGFLRQKENGWFVEWSNEVEHKQPLHSLPLHPNDTINRFELCEGKEVDFVISVRDELINGKNVPIKYAKLTFPDLKRCPYVCSPTFCSCKDGMCQHTKFLEKYDVPTDYLSDDAFENLEPIEIPTFNEENSFVSVVLANGYKKKGFGYVKVNENNTHWITFYILDEFQMYAYDSEDTEMEKIYDTGIIKTSESELQTLINVFQKYT